MDAGVLVLIYDLCVCVGGRGNPGDYSKSESGKLFVMYPNIHIYICVVIKIV